MTPLLYAIDSIEDDSVFAVSDDGNTVRFERSEFKEAIHEGDVFSLSEDGITLLPDETEKRRQETLALLKKLQKQ